MPTLQVSNGYKQALPTLATRKTLDKLGQKRVTTVVRDALRSQYGTGFGKVVSCSANLSQVGWSGLCWIQGTSYSYSVIP